MTKTASDASNNVLQLMVLRGLRRAQPGDAVQLVERAHGGLDVQDRARALEADVDDLAHAQRSAGAHL